MKRFLIIFCVITTTYGNEKSVPSGCLRRIMAKINVLFAHEPKIAPHSPQNSHELQNFTPFMHQAIYDPKKLEQTAIASHDILHKDRNGKTALHWVAQHGKDDSFALMQKLVDCKADINAQAHNGQTPLMCAIHAPYPEKTMLVLLASRADITIKDRNHHDVRDLIRLSELIHSKDALYGILRGHPSIHSSH